jgi:hypothetical protein
MQPGDLAANFHIGHPVEQLVEHQPQFQSSQVRPQTKMLAVTKADMFVSVRATSKRSGQQRHPRRGLRKQPDHDAVALFDLFAAQFDVARGGVTVSTHPQYDPWVNNIANCTIKLKSVFDRVNPADVDYCAHRGSHFEENADTAMQFQSELKRSLDALSTN